MQELIKGSWKAVAGLAFRRYFVNTIFDSTFVAMGIVIGASLAPGSTVKTVVSTLLVTSVALGISTGTSVYEAEKVEADIRLRELERAMLTELSGTDAKRALDVSRYMVVFVNVMAPIVVFSLAATPFILAGSLFIDAFPAALVSIGIAISVLFAVGAYLGRLSGGRAWLKGLRMALLGLGTFGAIWFIQGLVA